MALLSAPLRRLLVGLAAGLSCLAAVPAAAQPAESPPELNGLDAFITEALVRAKAPGAAISIVKDGEVILSRGYGARSLTSGLPMDSATLFPIQSETKAFTALTAVMLRDQGKLDLDAPIATYIPGFQMADRVATVDVSVRDFLTHRSGLGVYNLLWITNESATRANTVAKIAQLPPEASFRTTWTYANMGYVAAAHAIERQAGMPWEQLVEQRVFAPLGMARTTFSRDEAVRDSNHIDGSMVWDGRLIATPLQTTTPLTHSTGGIISTADDMAKWMLFQLGSDRARQLQLVEAQSLAETHQPAMITLRPVPAPEFTSSAYGLGWFVESYRGEKLIEHGGNHWGVNSAIGLLPDRNLGVSVFVNEDSDLAVYLMLAIFDRFIGPGARDWVQLAADSKTDMEMEHRALVDPPTQLSGEAIEAARPLSHYAGSYMHPGFGTIVVTYDEDRLSLRFDDDISALTPVGADVFEPSTTDFGNVWAMLADVKVQFVPDYDGRIVALRTSATVDGIVFTKE